MSEPNHVYENSEDALFRLFMDRMAVVEGERLFRENEKLKRDPDAAVPKKVQKRCLHKIKTEISRRNRTIERQSTWKVVRIAALAAAIVMLLGAVAFAAIPSFQARVLNVITNQKDGHIDWEFEVAPANSDSMDSSFSIAIPDGYLLARRDVNEISEYRLYTGASPSERSIQIAIVQINEGMRISTDSENLDYYEEIMVQGKYPGVLSEKDGFISIFWADTEHACHISISSNALTSDELMQMAESVQFA